MTFLVSGRLWRDSLIMQDRQTGTYWSHITGQALLGPLEGAELETIPSVQTRWALWKEQYPETEVLKKERRVGGSTYAAYFRDPDRMGLPFMRARWVQGRLPGKQVVHGIHVGPDALAVTSDWIEEHRRLTTELGGNRVEMTLGADGGVRAWRLNPDGDRTDELQVTTAFWFAWSSFYPDTRAVGGEGDEG